MRRHFKSVFSILNRIAGYHITWSEHSKTLWILVSMGWILLFLSLCFFLIFFGFYTTSTSNILEIFSTCGAWSLWLGGLIVLAFPTPRLHYVNSREGAMATCVVWIGVVCTVSIPFYVYAPQQGFSSACFEAVSCLTTTGVSLFKEALPQALEFWRVFLQWIGGLGIILMTFSLIPALQTNSSFIIFNEFSQRLEKTTPRTQTMATQIFLLYSTLTAIIAVLLWIHYTLPFTTCLHYSMSCLSTGGIEGSRAPVSGLTHYAKSILILGMIIGSLPFLVLLQGVRKLKTIIQDDQVRTYGILIAMSVFIACATSHFSIDYLFSTISCLTSTGFSCTSPLTPFATLWCFGLTFLGGCSGSSAGGLKIFRAQILYRITKNHIMQTLHPKRISVAHYNGKALKPQDVALLLSGFFIYLTGYVISTLCFALLGYSPKASCLLTCGFITNSGGGVYPISTYVQNFSPLEHWIGIFTMLLGRLESIFILGIISMFSRLR